MTSSASGPDSAFLPDDALPRGVPTGASPAAPGDAHWLHHAMAIWLAPEPSVDGDRTVSHTRPSPAH